MLIAALELFALVVTFWLAYLLRYPKQWLEKRDAIYNKVARFGLSAERMRRAEMRLWRLIKMGQRAFLRLVSFLSFYFNKACRWLYERTEYWLVGSSIFLAVLFAEQIPFDWPKLPPEESVTICVIAIGVGYTSLLLLIFRKVTFEAWHFPITVITYISISLILCFILSTEAYTESLVTDAAQSGYLHQKEAEERLEAIAYPIRLGKQRVAEAKKKADDADIAPPTLETAIYFTVITFTTVGYGDVQPAGTCGRVFACFVALLGTTHAVFFVSMVVAVITDPTRGIVKPGKYISRRR